MDRYEKTYGRYVTSLTCLRNELCKLEPLENKGFCGKQVSDIITNINSSIRTAEMMRNVPSSELYSITSSMADLYQNARGIVSLPSSEWRKCFKILSEASLTLATITDDPYVKGSLRMSESLATA